MIGVDIENLSRFEHLTEEGLQRIFTKNEIEYAKSFENHLEHLTGFYCAKEAFIKAIDEDNVDYIQIEILHKESGKPYINMTPYLRKILREKFVEDIDVSISHCKQYSMAVVQI